jgi:MFS family permease
MWGGVLADRWDRRKILIVTQAAQAALAVGLGLLTISGNVELWQIYVFALALGLVTAPDIPSRHALVSELTPAEDLVNAHSLTGAVQNLGRLVGPALAAVLIATLGTGVAFLVNGASFVAVIVSLVLIRIPRARDPIAPGDAAGPALRAFGQVREGLAYVWSNPTLRDAVIVIGLIGVFGQNFRIVLPLLAQREFDGGAEVYGGLMALVGLGAVVGALVAAARSTVAFATVLATALLFGLAMAFAAVSPWLWFALVAMIPLGFANVIVNIVARTHLQLQSRPAMVGRVMALYSMVTMGATPVGSLIAGALADGLGVRAAMLIAAAAAIVPAIVFGVRARTALRPPPPPSAGD